MAKSFEIVELDGRIIRVPNGFRVWSIEFVGPRIKAVTPCALSTYVPSAGKEILCNMMRQCLWHNFVLTFSARYILRFTNPSSTNPISTNTSDILVRNV